jgi:hypothetical protein
MLIRCICLIIFASIPFLTDCAANGVGGIRGNEGGSEPINSAEIPAYQKAVNRCHQTGGTRVVKIDGNLRCF